MFKYNKLVSYAILLNKYKDGTNFFSIILFIINL